MKECLMKFLCNLFGWNYFSQETIDSYDVCGTVSDYIEINV